MIHILDQESWNFYPDWSRDDAPFQYITLQYFIKNFLFFGAPTRVQTTYKGEVSAEYIENVLNEHPEVNIFACNLDCFKDKHELFLHDERIAKKYPNVFFIFWYNELDYSAVVNNADNVIYIMNTFNTTNIKEKNKYQAVRGKIFSYYLVNSYLQENYKRVYQMYRINCGKRKFKKYNFLNGIHKPHRFIAYELIKKHNLLDEGFFSYLDYTKFREDDSHTMRLAEFLDMSFEDCKQQLSETEIPYLLDTYEPVGHPGDILVPFMIPTMYSWQSYISITSETNYIEDPNIISISEKSFKPFSGFNIPLIYGQPHLVDYLRDLGFDMFDDLFDNTPTISKYDTIAKLDKNLQTIKNMSLKELHEYYVSNWNRIEHNFLMLTKEIKNKHFRDIHNNLGRVLNSPI